MRKGLIRAALACIGSMVLTHPVLAAPVSHEAADAQLRAIYDAQWKWWKEQMAEEPDDERPGNESGHLPQVDAASQASRLAHLKEVMADLNAVDFAHLSAEEKVNAQVFRAIIEERISDLHFKTYQAPFNADSFFWTEFTPREQPAHLFIAKAAAGDVIAMHVLDLFAERSRHRQHDPIAIADRAVFLDDTNALPRRREPLESPFTFVPRERFARRHGQGDSAFERLHDGRTVHDQARVRYSRRSAVDAPGTGKMRGERQCSQDRLDARVCLR